MRPTWIPTIHKSPSPYTCSGALGIGGWNTGCIPYARLDSRGHLTSAKNGRTLLLCFTASFKEKQPYSCICHTTGHKSYHKLKLQIFTLAFLQYWVFLQFIYLSLQCESTNSAETFCYAVGSLNPPTIAGLSSKHS